MKAPYADFHHEIMEDLKKIEKREKNEYVLVAFRLSAKSSIAKAYVTWLAYYKKRNYIVITSYDPKNSDKYLSSLANNFSEKGNPLLYNDMMVLWGKKLFTKERDKDEITQKTQSIFRLENGVWVEGGSVNTTFRGRNDEGNRIDFIIMDDIENIKTVSSLGMTQKIREQMDELRSASDIVKGVSVVYLGNKISANGNIAYLEERAKTNDRMIYREYPIEDKDGNPLWGSYHTRELISQYREDFSDTFEPEFLNQPFKSGDMFKPNVDSLRSCVEMIPPKKDKIIIGMDTGARKYIVVGDSKGLFVNDFCEDYSQLEYYLNKYPDSMAVLDGQGDPTKTKEMQLKYDGRVYVCFFKQDSKSDEIVKLVDDEYTIIADRNRLITWTYDEFEAQRTVLHGDLEYWDELYIKHWCNMYRIAKMTATGIRKVWDRKGGDHKNGDHLALASVYWRAGVQLLGKAQSFMIVKRSGMVKTY